MQRAILDYLVYLVVRLLFCIVQSLSMESCRRLAAALAWLVHEVLRFRRSVVEENLRRAFPEWSPARRDRAARRMWAHLALMACELAHVPRKIHRTNWKQFVDYPQKTQLVELLLQRRPVVFVSGHYGNFELAGYIAGLMGFPTFTIARPLDNPYLHDFINRFRGATGQFMLPKEGSAGQVQAVLEANLALALLGDQYAGPKGCWVEFFNRPASCHKAVALFTLTAGAPLAVVYARRIGEPMRFEIGLAGLADPAAEADERLQSVKSLTAWYNAVLERVIREAPEQYWWVHRRWKGRPKSRRRTARRAA